MRPGHQHEAMYYYVTVCRFVAALCGLVAADGVEPSLWGKDCHSGAAINAGLRAGIKKQHSYEEKPTPVAGNSGIEPEHV